MASLIHNRILLYVIFLISLVDFLYLVSINDMESASLFVLLIILTAFFSKNMTIILLIALIITNLHKYGKINPSKKEGLENKKSKKKQDKIKKDNEETEETEETEEPEEPEETEENNEQKLSVDNSVKTTTEHFDQDKTIITTSDEDKDIRKSDKMMSAQEKMLERMNKYKPLLDTLNGLTKNIAIVKGLASSDKE